MEAAGRTGFVHRLIPDCPVEFNDTARPGEFSVYISAIVAFFAGFSQAAASWSFYPSVSAFSPKLGVFAIPGDSPPNNGAA